MLISATATGVPRGSSSVGAIGNCPCSDGGNRGYPQSQDSFRQLKTESLSLLKRRSLGQLKKHSRSPENCRVRRSFGGEARSRGDIRRTHCFSFASAAVQSESETRDSDTAGMSGKGHLVVVGSANADIYLEIQRLPLKGETISASGGRTLPGGKGANQAACGARLGLDTHFVAQLGEDAYAGLLEKALQESGVKTGELRRVSGVPTGHAVVMLQPDGSNSIIIVGGSNTAWSNSEAGSYFSEEGVNLLKTAGAVLLQREIPDEVNLEAAQIAHAAGVPVVLDVGGVEAPISDALLSCLEVISPNETELQRLVGLPTSTDNEIKVAAEVLLKKGVPHALVKLGSDGSLLLSSGGDLVRQECVPAPEVVDTTGAGDTFTAAFAVGLVQGMTLPHAMQYASSAASLTVRKKGAMPSLPFKDDVNKLFSQTFAMAK